MKKIITIILFIVFTIGSFIGGFFIGKTTNKKNNDKEEVSSNKEFKYVNINEVYKLSLLEFTLKKIEFNQQICYNTNHDNYLFAAENDIALESHKEPNYLNTTNQGTILANEGEVFATIEYTLKNISNEKVDLRSIDAVSKFKFIYDDNYTFEDDRGASEILKGDIGAKVRSLNNKNSYNKEYNTQEYNWYTRDSDYILNPLSDEIVLREYIRVPEKVANDTEKSLILTKEFSNSNSLVEFERESVYINIR